jgi:hypothetical protein
MRKRYSIVWVNTTDDEFEELVNNSHTYKELALKLGTSSNGCNNNTIKARIDSLGLSTDHFDAVYNKMVEYNNTRLIPLSKVLVNGSNYNRRSLKKRLIADGILLNKCSKCGLGNIWNGESITLQLDHINGTCNDNRLDNLRIICPNCHSQTHNFAGRNNKRISITKRCDCGVKIHKKSIRCRICAGKHKKTISMINRPELHDLISNIETYGYSGTGRVYDVSDNAVRKWVKAYGVDPKSIKRINYQ